MQQWLAMVTWHRLPVLARPRRHAERQVTGLTPLRRAKLGSRSCQFGVEFCPARSCARHLTLAAQDRETTNPLAQGKFDKKHTHTSMVLGFFFLLDSCPAPA